MTALEEIKKALAAAEQFIVNGVELGYIRMPNPDTPDSAHDTLPMIRQAQTALESLQRENEALRANVTRTRKFSLDMGRACDLAEIDADHLLSRAEAAEAEVKRLKSVLGPIAELAGDVSELWPDDAQVVTEIGHFRRARTALASTGGEHHAE